MSTQDASAQQRLIDALRSDNAELARVINENARLHADRLYLASIVEFSNDAIIAIDMSGLVTSWNRAAWCMFGYEKAEIIGKPIAQLVPPNLRYEQEEILMRIKSGEIVAQYETARLQKDGKAVQVALMASPIVNAAGDIIGVSKIIHDITAQKQAREELRLLQSELVHLSRWNMMGMMASSLAHELNQPLTAILNYVRAARRMLKDIPAATVVVSHLDKALQETQLAGGIIRSLRAFIQKREITLTPEKINAVLEEGLALSLYIGTEGRDRIHIKFADGLPAVLADKVQIQQVLLNLVRNSLEAIKELPHAILVIETQLDEPGFVTVSVSDTGPGLAPEIAERLFQPFSTTKTEGMGVGLSICQSIMRWHGGRIWTEPNSPQGVIFRFKLPIAERDGDHAS